MELQAKTLQNMLIIMLFCLLSISPIPANADIFSYTFDKDPRRMIVFEEFSFTAKGYLTLDLSDVFIHLQSTNITPAAINTSQFGILVTPTYVPHHACLVDVPDVVVVSTLSDVPLNGTGSIRKTVAVPIPKERIVVFSNCLANISSVSMKITIETYNLDNDGKKDFLPYGENHLPTFFFVFSGFYICLLIIWIRECLSNEPFVRKIHILMGVLVFFKFLNLFCAAEDKLHVKVNGTHPTWGLLFDVSQVIRVTLFVAVVVLIGAGWSIIKPILHTREKIVLLIGIPVQILVNLGFLILGDHNAYVYNMDDWLIYLIIIDFLSSLFILWPIQSTITTLKEDANKDGRAVANIRRMRTLRDFLLAAFVYLYFNKNVISLTLEDLTYDLKWFYYLCMEVVTLGFYMVMLILIRPQPNNQYFPLGDDDEAIALSTIRHEFADF